MKEENWKEGDKGEPQVLISQGRNLVTSKIDKSRNSRIRVLFRNIEANMSKKIAQGVERGGLWK